MRFEARGGAMADPCHCACAVEGSAWVSGTQLRPRARGTRPHFAASHPCSRQATTGGPAAEPGDRSQLPYRRKPLPYGPTRTDRPRSSVCGAGGEARAGSDRAASRRGGGSQRRWAGGWLGSGWGSSPALPLLCCALLGVLAAMGPPGAVAAPFSVLDSFRPRCTPLPDHPHQGFKRWSDKRTWGKGPIPGVGKAELANVTIPCGTAILLDVPNVNLNMLVIRGMLQVEDPAKGKPRGYSVQACFVLVEGQLIVGHKTRPLRSRVQFTLQPNPWQRQEYVAWFNPPADVNHPRLMGHKAFVVVGGYVSLYGMPGGTKTPSWVKLAETAPYGARTIVVDQDVSRTWPVGAKIALASTGYYPSEAEDAFITAVRKHPKGSAITLSQTLQWMHFGDPKGVRDGFGGYIDERGEVALLSRNIVITGTDEPAPNNLEGGHFMIFMTRVPQTVEGVEFFKMGQQGKLGRYSIHLHVCRDVKRHIVIRKNAIHSSKQRCVVVHATDAAVVDSNVAYDTAGHCFMLEEGGEQDNLLVNNLGFSTHKVEFLIKNGYVPGSSLETDVVPSTFWITNMHNEVVGNVAAGSDDSGIWTELRPSVRGMSSLIPDLMYIRPQSSPIKLFKDNCVHSNAQMGFRAYPHGINPRSIWRRDSKVPFFSWPVGNGVIQGLRVYKHTDIGFFMHQSSNLRIVDSSFADNRIAVQLQGNDGGAVINSRFAGLSANRDTLVPAWCQGPDGQALCSPINGCDFNPDDVNNLRLTGGAHWKEPRFGIILDHLRIGFDGSAKYTLSNNTFSSYDHSCGKPQAAIGTGLIEGTLQWWNSGQSVEKLRFGPGVNPIWFAPKVYRFPMSPYTFRSGEPGQNYAIWDKDGSIVGHAGGYVVGTDPFLRPLPRYKCRVMPNSNALACPATCYRTLYVSYREPGFSPFSGDSTRKLGTFSYVRIRRVNDGAERVSPGNLNDDPPTGARRDYVFTVMAPASYEITIAPPTANPGWAPDGLSLGFRDGPDGGCFKSVDVVLMPPAAGAWALQETDQQAWKPCPGMRGLAVKRQVLMSNECRQGLQTLRLLLVRRLNYYLSVVNRRDLRRPCSPQSRCALWGSAEVYWYSTSGNEPRALVFGMPGFQMPIFPQGLRWKRGAGIIGIAGWPFSSMRSITPRPSASRLTYFYRKTFTLQDSACYSAMVLDFFQTQALAAYLNGVEVFRFNLPQGNISSSTKAQVPGLWFPNNKPGAFNSTLIDLDAHRAALVEGKNFMAFETHVAGAWQGYSYFDVRLSLIRSSATCKGPKKLPEVCDGLDNDLDGLVDVDVKTGKPLRRRCSTPCGGGWETCRLGSWQGCTAKKPQAETCNGRDDNCDGLVDNGPPGSSLGCRPGSLCFGGKCLPTMASVSAVPLVKSGSTWLYRAGGNPFLVSRNWMTGDVAARFQTIRTPCGSAASPHGKSGATLPVLSKPYVQYYFLKSFELSQKDADRTVSLAIRTKRDAALVAFVNDNLVLSSNFPAWFNPHDSNQILANAQATGTDISSWYQSGTPYSTGSAGGIVKAGTNWIAATLGMRYAGSTLALFDFELLRNVNSSCSSLPGKPKQCLRVNPVPQTLISYNSAWRYLDASRMRPPFSWTSPAFDDSTWPQGTGPLGNLQSTKLNMNRQRRAYYFRKTLDVPQGHCFVGVQISIRALDGAVVYINGVEALRWRIDPSYTYIFPWSYANNMWPATDTGNYTLSTGWLRKGRNVIAAEVHISQQPTSTWYFDLAMAGTREQFTCT